jgi:hypothetical protein
MRAAPTPAMVAYRARQPAKRCYYCGLLAPVGCLCDACCSDDPRDQVCRSCLRAEAIADDRDQVCRSCLRAEAIADDSLLTLEAP